MKAYVFMKIDHLAIDEEVLDILRAFENITEANRVFGEWDIITEIKTDTEKELGNIVNEIRRLNAVKETMTFIVEI